MVVTSVFSFLLLRVSVRIRRRGMTMSRTHFGFIILHGTNGMLLVYFLKVEIGINV